MTLDESLKEARSHIELALKRDGQMQIYELLIAMQNLTAAIQLIRDTIHRIESTGL